MTDADAATVEIVRGEAVVRRSPRYLRFLLAGAIVGILVALILTVTFPANPEFSIGQVFGFLLLLCGVIGLALGAVIALVFDRVLSKRAHTEQVEHTTLTTRED
ncbi:hypothetical protein ASC59_11700 [Leifsonia sp. Root1293]|nr:hypothetical protein ASC59_11700 [Leifsonia sp. Root1293]KRA12861.1 hypothetical protein ASD61_11700 [Leifsonia sp. Root60]